MGGVGVSLGRVSLGRVLLGYPTHTYLAYNYSSLVLEVQECNNYIKQQPAWNMNDINIVEYLHLSHAPFLSMPNMSYICTYVH